MTDEIWKQIENYNFYMISNFGRVLNSKSNKILKQQTNKKGYLKITLCENYKKETKQIHRLVANAFIENPLMLPEVDHIDRVKSNNHINNLRWASPKQQKANKNVSKINSTGFKGVYWIKKSNKYRAIICVNYKSYHLGYYDTKENAKIVYDYFAEKINKDFANIDKSFLKVYTPELVEKIIFLKNYYKF